MPDDTKAVVMRFTLPDLDGAFRRSFKADRGGRLQLDLPRQDLPRVEALFELAEEAANDNLPLILVVRKARPDEVDDIPFWRVAQERFAAQKQP